jgi:hypothetical protein
MLKRLRQMLFEHLGIKIASLVLALAVYWHVYYIQGRSVVMQISLTVEGLPPGLAYRGEIPRQIRVRVHGQGGELLKLRVEPPRAVVALTQPRIGQLQRPVTTADVVLPPKSEAMVEGLVEPVVLSLVIEPIRSVRLPIVVRTRGAPSEGFVRYGPVRIFPETLTVVGPTSLVAALDSIPTEDVDVSGRSEAVGETTHLRFPEGVRARIDRVSVRVPIVRVSHRDFGPVHVTLAPEFRSAWAISPDSVRVRLAGPKPLMDAITASDLRPRAKPPMPIGVEDVIPVELGLAAALRADLRVETIDPPTVSLVGPMRSKGGE